jgi:ubiquinone/menaquinone biosynthesis C-methylase UbiE
LKGYYSEQLSAERLRRCYEIAPPRVRRYLNAEIEHVLSRVRPSDTVLELGCGYGRVVARLAESARLAVGVDTSRPSLRLGRELLRSVFNCRLLQMDAVALEFRDHSFDVTVCVQNGISAFKVNRRDLIAEAIRVTRPGGRVLFSSYAEKFWDARLEWFRLQAEERLVGEIDWEATGDGVIVCKDGFRATTITPTEFMSLTSGLRIQPHIEEVEESSLFCELLV